MSKPVDKPQQNGIKSKEKPLSNGHQKKESKSNNFSNPLPEIDEDLKYEVPPLEIDPNNVDPTRVRRFSVSAEVTDNTSKPFDKKVYPKSDAALKRIINSIKDVFLFKGLDKEQRQLLIDAMFEKRVKKGTEIISQGDGGDYFYVIEKGKYEVWKKPETKKTLNKTEQKENENKVDITNNVAKKVFEYDNKGSFGELALMYNSKRAATVKSQTKGILWAVDRQTFRHIMLQTNNRKRKLYDKILKEISLLKGINDEDGMITQISDSLESEIFKKNEYIIKQNDEIVNTFYIIIKGECDVTINDDNNQIKKVNTLKKGDYFGERGILLNDLRSASVQAKTEVECACVNKETFIRLFQTSNFEEKFKKKFMKYKFSQLSNELSDIED